MKWRLPKFKKKVETWDMLPPPVPQIRLRAEKGQIIQIREEHRFQTILTRIYYSNGETKVAFQTAFGWRPKDWWLTPEGISIRKWVQLVPGYLEGTWVNGEWYPPHWGKE